MALTNYARGTNFERRIAADLESNGYWTIRAGGSHGCADVVAIKLGQILFVQCKINGKISPADRVTLCEVCTTTGAIPIVAYRPSPRTFAYRRVIDPHIRGGSYAPFTIDQLA